MQLLIKMNRRAARDEQTQVRQVPLLYPTPWGAAKKLMILFSSFHLPRDDSLASPFLLKTFFAFSCGKWVEDGTQTHPEPWGLIRILRGERK